MFNVLLGMNGNNFPLYRGIVGWLCLAWSWGSPELPALLTLQARGAGDSDLQGKGKAERGRFRKVSAPLCPSPCSEQLNSANPWAQPTPLHGHPSTQDRVGDPTTALRKPSELPPARWDDVLASSLTFLRSCITQVPAEVSPWQGLDKMSLRSLQTKPFLGCLWLFGQGQNC